MLEKTELELVDGLTNAYSRHISDISLIPFLYMARCMMQSGGFLFNIGGGEKPLLRGGIWKKKEAANEKHT